MAEIHNINIKIPIYFKDKCIGICTSIVAFADVRAQICEQNLTGYFFEFNNVKYELSPKGYWPDNVPNNWYEYLYSDSLAKIVQIEFQ